LFAGYALIGACVIDGFIYAVIRVANLKSSRWADGKAILAARAQRFIYNSFWSFFRLEKLINRTVLVADAGNRADDAACSTVNADARIDSVEFLLLSGNRFYRTYSFASTTANAFDMYKMSHMTPVAPQAVLNDMRWKVS
jgi:hypothetical protein